MDETETQAEGGSALTERIIDRFGGIRPMATKIDVPVTTVQGWKKRGVIPAVRHEDILAAAAREGVMLDPAELAQTDPAPRTTGSEASSRPIGFERPVTFERPMSANPISPSPPIKTGRKTAAVALVFALSALIAAVGGGAAGWRFYIAPMRADIAALQSRSVAIDPDFARRLAALESRAGQPAGPSSPDTGLADRLSAIEQKIAQMPAAAPDTQQVAKQISDLQVAAGGRELLAQSIRDIQSSAAAAQGQIEQLGSQLRAVGTRLDQVDAALAQRRQEALRAEAVVLAAGQLRAALKTSAPFADEVASLKTVTGNDPQVTSILDPVQPLADTGVPTTDELRENFARLAPEIVRSAVVGDGSSWWRQALYRVESVISVRRVGDTAPADTVDAVVSGAEARLEEGNLRAAINAVRGLSGAPAATVTPWINDAENRIAADNAEAALTRLAIDRVATGSSAAPQPAAPQ